MSPHLPITPEEIAADAIGAAEAGAAILHLHARNPDNGKPDQTPAAFARFLPRIKASTEAVINITTGGSPFMKVEERVLPAAQFKPEVASLNMGSFNFGLYHLAAKYETFKYDWEKPHLESTRDLVFRNSFKDIEYISDLRRQRHAIRVRVLRHRAPVQPRAFRQPGSREAALFRADGIRNPRRHRDACRRCDAYEANG